MTNCNSPHCRRGITTQYCDTHRSLFATFAMMNAHGHFWIEGLEDEDFPPHLPNNPVFDYLQEDEDTYDEGACWTDREYAAWLANR